MKKWTVLVAMVLGVWGCDEGACETDGAFRCTESTLEECVDGQWEVAEECAESDMICHDMGDESHCMLDGEM